MEGTVIGPRRSNAGHYGPSELTRTVRSSSGCLFKQTVAVLPGSPETRWRAAIVVRAGAGRGFALARAERRISRWEEFLLNTGPSKPERPIGTVAQ